MLGKPGQAHHALHQRIARRTTASVTHLRRGKERIAWVVKHDAVVEPSDGCGARRVAVVLMRQHVHECLAKDRKVRSVRTTRHAVAFEGKRVRHEAFQAGDDLDQCLDDIAITYQAVDPFQGRHGVI